MRRRSHKRCTIDPELLRQLLLSHKIATMEQLKDVLGTQVDMTVFRKLRALEYCSSYSHRGKYYTLREIAEFDEVGLWSFRTARFSKHGTLLKTCEVLIGGAEMGYARGELEKLLHVQVKDALRQLAHEGRIFREKIGGRFVHFAVDPSVRREQHRARRRRKLRAQGAELDWVRRAGGGLPLAGSSAANDRL